MNEELKAELETLKKGLETKSASDAKEAVEALELKVKENIDGETKAIKEAFEIEIKSLNDKLAEVEKKAAEDLQVVQDHADKLDIKLQEKKKEQKAEQTYELELKSKLEEGIDKIGQVRKGQSHKLMLDTKDMTLGGNLTGDQPRAYSNSVAMLPRQLVNFVDLIGPSIDIAGGTYTFPREDASTNNVGTPAEGATKGINDYAVTMVDVNTDFLAGYSRYSKKMRNNLPFLQSFVPNALRRDYMKAENASFYSTLSTGATASTQIITNKNKVEMLINEIATLEGLDYETNGITLRPADWYDIAITEKSTGAGYGLPGIVSYSNGVLTVNGIQVFKANWLAANKYLVGDWSTVKKVVTEGLGVEFSEEDGDNFKQNMITARIESQVGLAVERPDSIIFGDFTAV